MKLSEKPHTDSTISLSRLFSSGGDIASVSIMLFESISFVIFYVPMYAAAGCWFELNDEFKEGCWSVEFYVC